MPGTPSCSWVLCLNRGTNPSSLAIVQPEPRALPTLTPTFNLKSQCPKAITLTKSLFLLLPIFNSISHGCLLSFSQLLPLVCCLCLLPKTQTLRLSPLSQGDADLSSMFQMPSPLSGGAS